MEDLNKAKTILNRNRLEDDLFMRIYSFATENISGYMQYFNLKNKSLLTVGSSGDQIINAYNNGCKDITLLDVNPFAPYYVNLKIAAILSLTYQEFQLFFFRWLERLEKNNERYNLYLFNKLSDNLKNIDYNSYYFFKEIFNNYQLEKISDYLMNDDENNYRVIKGINNYLQDEESYNQTKMILKDIGFKYINENIFRITDNIKYDNIFLSNICTYVTLLELKDLIEKLKNNNLNDGGSMLFAYLWDTNFDDNEPNLEFIEIYRMPATRHWLKEYITDYYQIPGISDILFRKDKNSDLVLVYRK